MISSYYLSLQLLYLFFFATASILFVYLKNVFLYLFWYFFVIKFYVLNHFFAQYKRIRANTSVPPQPYEGLHMFYTRRSTHKRMLHILRWTSAVCLQGARCRSRSRGRALYHRYYLWLYRDASWAAYVLLRLSWSPCHINISMMPSRL